MSSRVTLQTIADTVGVSRATVSNAYNRPDQLRPELRARILETAEKLGYRGPDAAARMLRTGRTGAIGLLFTEDLGFVFSDPDTTSFMRGVAETSALARTALTLLPIPLGVDVAATALTSAAVDGYLVFSVDDDHPGLAWILALGKPVVLVDEPDLGDAVSFVGIDDRGGAALAAAHLTGLGHRSVAVLLGRVDEAGTQGPGGAALAGRSPIRIVRERLAGYLETFARGGVPVEDVVVWVAGANDPDAGRRATLELLQANPGVTGLVCFTDQLAIGAAQAAQRLHRPAPSGLSVVGFDDIPRAAAWDPPLTTVHQPLVDKGRMAADLLMQQIIDGGRGRILLPIELVIRDSTASPPLVA